MAPKVENKQLLAAGLQVMKASGKSLTKLQSHGRSMIYALADGRTVRVRTCNDPLLIVLSSEHSGKKARLNIEGTDLLLFVMPAMPRTEGEVNVYLIPTDLAVKASRDAHASWLAGKPNTKGNNTTWNLWFEEKSGPWGGYASKWKQFLLRGVSTPTLLDSPAVTKTLLKTEIESARERIASVAGVAIESVKVTIEFAH